MVHFYIAQSLGVISFTEFFKASNVAWEKEEVVFVAPMDFDQQSFTPAIARILFAVSPATRPKPFAPGISVTTTLPLLPSTLKGRV
jgi:hypothetical protein